MATFLHIITASLLLAASGFAESVNETVGVGMEHLEMASIEDIFPDTQRAQILDGDVDTVEGVCASLDAIIHLA